MKSRIYQIDILRFTAALSVLLFHYSFQGHSLFPQLPVWGGITTLTRYGYLGVDLFFIISGFVIAMSADNRKTSDFVISRITRLYPAFWVCCTISVLVILIGGADLYRVEIKQYLVNLTMLSGFTNVPAIDGSYWSLRVEISFYFWVFVLLLLGQYRRILWFAAAWLGLSVVFAIYPPPQIVRGIVISEWSAYFIAGITFFSIWQQGLSWKKLLLVAGSLALALERALNRLPYLEQTHVGAFHNYAVVSLITLFFVLMLAVSTRRLEFFNRPIFETLGKLTYPLYLLHQVGGYVYMRRMGNIITDPHALIASAAILFIGLAYVVSHFIEEPLAKILKQILRKPLAKSAA